MSHINLATKLAIKKNIKEFLKGFPREHSVEPNCRHTGFYKTAMSTMCDTFCSSPSVSTLTVPVSSLDGIVTGVQRDIDNVQSLRLSPKHQISIKKTLKKKRGISIVYVTMVSPPGSPNHATLMVFDASTRKQHFFNPWGHTAHWLQRAIAERAPFVEGFEVASRFEDSWGESARSLQTLFDETGVWMNEPGNCGLWVFFVSVLCLRFGVGDPKLMATLFMSASGAEERRIPGEFTTRLWTWMTSMERSVRVLRRENSTPAQKKAARQELSVKMFHSNQTSSCGIYCPKSDTVCVRKACQYDVFCWQHRFLTRNKDKRGKNKMKCSATQVKCRYRLM